MMNKLSIDVNSYVKQLPNKNFFSILPLIMLSSNPIIIPLICYVGQCYNAFT